MDHITPHFIFKVTEELKTKDAFVGCYSIQLQSTIRQINNCVVRESTSSVKCGAILCFDRKQKWYMWRMIGSGTVPKKSLKVVLDSRQLDLRLVEEAPDIIKRYLAGDIDPDDGKMLSTMWPVAMNGKIQSGGLRPYSKYTTKDERDGFRSDATPSIELLDIFRDKFGVNETTIVSGIDREKKRFNGIDVHNMRSNEDISVSSRALMSHLYNEYAELEFVHVETDQKLIKWVSDIFYEKARELPGWRDGNELPNEISTTQLIVISDKVMSSVATRIGVIWGKDKSVVYSVRQGRQMELVRMPYTGYTQMLGAKTVCMIPGKKKPKPVTLKDIWNQGINQLTNFNTITYIPYGGQFSRFELNPVREGVLNLYLPSPIPVEHFSRSSWREPIKAIVKTGKTYSDEEFDALLDIMVDMMKKKYSKYFTIPDNAILEAFLHQVITIMQLVWDIVCVHDEEKHTKFYRKILFGLVYPQPTPEYLKEMMLFIGEKGRGKSAILAWFKRLYGRNGVDGKGMADFLKSQGSFTYLNKSQLIIFDEVKFPRGMWELFKEYIKCPELSYETKFAHRVFIPNSHLVFATMNDGLPQETNGEKEPPIRRISTFRMGRMNGTSERAQKNYEDAFSFPAHLPKETSDALICFAIDFLNIVYGAEEEEYYKPQPCKAATLATIKLFESTLSENREIAFLEYIVTYMRNVEGKSNTIVDELEKKQYAKIPSICHSIFPYEEEKDNYDIIPEKRMAMIDDEYLIVEYVNYSPTTSTNSISVALRTYYAEEVKTHDGYADFIMNTKKAHISKVFDLFKNLNRISAQSDNELLFNHRDEWINYMSLARERVTIFQFPPFTTSVFKLICSPEFYGSQVIIKLYPRYKMSDKSPAKNTIKFTGSDDKRIMSFADLLIWFICFKCWKNSLPMQSIIDSEPHVISPDNDSDLIEQFIEVIHNHAYTAKELGDEIARKGSSVDILARVQYNIWKQRMEDDLFHEYTCEGPIHIPANIFVPDSPEIITIEHISLCEFFFNESRSKNKRGRDSDDPCGVVKKKRIICEEDDDDMPLYDDDEWSRQLDMIKNDERTQFMDECDVLGTELLGIVQFNCSDDDFDQYDNILMATFEKALHRFDSGADGKQIAKKIRDRFMNMAERNGHLLAEEISSDDYYYLGGQKF